MARIKFGKVTRRRHKAVLQAVRGHRGSRSRRYKVAKESLIHALDYATRHRRLKKRENRALFIIRINAAARINGISYSRLIEGIKVSRMNLDRKSLADLATFEPDAFTAVVSRAKAALTIA